MSNKVVDGVELLRMIRDGELEKYTILEIVGHRNKKIEWQGDDSLIDLDTAEPIKSCWLIDTELEIISPSLENEEIDIESIEELEIYVSNGLRVPSYDSKDIKSNRVTINDLIKAVKQINRKVEGK